MTASDRRPWYRLHLSTWVAIAVTLALLTLIVVPGGYPSHGPFGISSFGPPPYAHGWPFVWLVRYVPKSPFVPGQGAELWHLCWARFGDAFWMECKFWPFSGQCFLQWKGLVLDLLVALAVTTAIAFPWEWRCRSASSMGFAACWCSFSWSRSSWLGGELRPCSVRGKSTPPTLCTTTVSGRKPPRPAPDWLCRLVGWDRLPYFVIGIGRYPSDRRYPSDQQGAQDPESAAFGAARDFRNLDCVEMLTADDRTMMLLSALSRDLERLHGSAGLRKVHVSETDVTDAGLEYLKGLVQLRELDLRWTKVTAEGVKRLQQRLPNCDIMWEPRSDDK